MGGTALWRGLWAGHPHRSGVRQSGSRPQCHRNLARPVWVRRGGGHLFSLKQLDPIYKEADFSSSFFWVTSISGHLFSPGAPPQASCLVKRGSSLSGWVWVGSEEVPDQLTPSVSGWCVALTVEPLCDSASQGRDTLRCGKLTPRKAGMVIRKRGMDAVQTINIL